MLRRATGSLLATLLGLTACGEPPPAATPPAQPTAAPPAASSAKAPDPGPPAAAKAAPEKLSADAPRATPGGTTFTAPASWSFTASSALVLLEAPEGDTHVALVDVKTADADAAVAAAWAAYGPARKKPLKRAAPQPARKGWEEQRNYEYETSPNERAVVFASARRHGESWTVLLVDASTATIGRRVSQVILVEESLLPAGYKTESFVGKKAHPLDAERIKLLTDFVEAARKELGVPGVALSLVDGGKVVFEGGFGVRELGKKDPVDKDTLFLIASNTKGMTTLLLAKLVDEGKLQWDMPVTKAYPGFRLGDAETTSRVQIKHLICACTGLPRQDLEWLFEFKKATPKSTLDLLGTVQPTSKFGEVFQYSNLLAAAAGYVGAHVIYPDKELGQAYDEAMRTRVFEPLGMKGATFDLDRAMKGDHAAPHGEDVDGKPAVARMDVNRSIAPVRPAGGAFTSVHDLTKYVQMEIARGKLPDGKRLASEENVLARRAPQIALGADAAYGMGLEVDHTWGVPVVHHGGSMIGYKSDLMFLPDYGVGAVIFANADAGRILLAPFMRRLLEVLFDGKSEALEDVMAAAKEHRARLAKERERLVVPPDPAEVGKLAPRYVSPVLGEVTVKKDGAATVFDFGEWSSAVASRKNDDGTISFQTISPGTVGFEFVVGERDKKRELIIRDAQHEYALTEAR